MNTIYARINALFAFTVTILAILTFCCFLSTAFDTHKANVILNVPRAVVRKTKDYSAGNTVNDLGFVTLDIESDLNHLFNWNVKQLFLYVTAEYIGEDKSYNQVVLWDKIIQRGESSRVSLKNLNTKYYFWDDGFGLRGNQNVTLTMSWNVVPNAGRLLNIGGSGKYSFAFPNEYLSTR